MPLREALVDCRHAPPLNWPSPAYALIGRDDISEMLSAQGEVMMNKSFSSTMNTSQALPLNAKDPSEEMVY